MKTKKYPNLNNKRWQVYEGGNFVLVVTAEFKKWLKKNDYLGGPYKVCVMAYEHCNEVDYKVHHRRAVSMARRIVADHNTILDFTQQMIVDHKIKRNRQESMRNYDPFAKY